MDFNLMMPDEVREMLKARIESKEWWLFPVVDDEAGMLEVIEATYYSGEAGVDFEMVAGGPTVAMARKSRMSPEQLAEIVQQFVKENVDPEQLKDHDVFPLLPPEWVASGQAAEFMDTFLTFLFPDDGGQSNGTALNS